MIETRYSVRVLELGPILHWIEGYNSSLTILLAAGAITFAAWRKVIRPMLIAVANILEALQLLTSSQKELSELATAQLTKNGGGSLVDRVALIPGLVVTVGANHAEARGEWDGLKTSLTNIKSQFENEIAGITHDLSQRRQIMAAVIKRLPPEQQEMITEIITTMGAA